MQRFFSSVEKLVNDQVVFLGGSEHRHLTQVLRLRVGEEISLFNGKGFSALAKIQQIQKEQTAVIIRSVQKDEIILPRLVLACAIPKRAKFEFIIEKCTELGIDEIIPLITERTEVRPSGSQFAKIHDRYSKVAINAAKQCKRSLLPRISFPKSLFEIFELPPDGLNFIPWLDEKDRSIKTVLQEHPNPQTIRFFIGPEGDFSPKEVKAALHWGCHPVTLGPTVLKVDTAAIGLTALFHFGRHQIVSLVKLT